MAFTAMFRVGFMPNERCFSHTGTRRVNLQMQVGEGAVTDRKQVPTQTDPALRCPILASRPPVPDCRGLRRCDVVLPPCGLPPVL